MRRRIRSSTFARKVTSDFQSFSRKGHRGPEGSPKGAKGTPKGHQRHPQRGPWGGWGGVGVGDLGYGGGWGHQFGIKRIVKTEKDINLDSKG